jgi:hypothetical protein
MQKIPTWLKQAFIDWLTGRLYVDGRRNYRRRPDRRIVPYNQALKRLYPENTEFHLAANLWLALWDTVRIARLRQTV